MSKVVRRGRCLESIDRVVGFLVLLLATLGQRGRDLVPPIWLGSWRWPAILAWVGKGFVANFLLLALFMG
jgi:hypothetical protein